jgi:hypothetical protein
MIQFEPGTPFDITFGKGYKLTVRSLDVRKKAKLITMMGEIQNAGQEAFNMLISAVEMCSPTITDEQWQLIDERAASEIILMTLANGGLSEDERKKFELPH